MTEKNVERYKKTDASTRSGVAEGYILNKCWGKGSFF
jgi:hypothetical protein